MKFRNSRGQKVSTKQRRQKKTRGARPKGKSVDLGIVERRLTVPVAYGKRERVGARSLSSSIRGGRTAIVVKNREYIAEVFGTVGYTSTTYSVNPGMPNTCPWLSTIAVNFEMYRFRRLAFEFETQAPTTATGTVLLAADLDASDAAPTNKMQAMSYEGSTRSPPWTSCRYSFTARDMDRNGPDKYVRGAAAPVGTDIKTYDVGNLFLITQGQANTNLIGELYVDYEVELFIPQEGVARALYNNCQRLNMTSNVAQTQWFGGTCAYSSYGAGLVVLDGGTANKFSLPAGTWLFNIYVTGTVFTGTTPTWTNTAGSVLAVTNPNAGLYAASTGTSAMYQFTLYSPVNFSFTLTNPAALCTTATACQLRVVAYDTLNVA